MFIRKKYMITLLLLATLAFTLNTIRGNSKSFINNLDNNKEYKKIIDFTKKHTYVDLGKLSEKITDIYNAKLVDIFTLVNQFCFPLETIDIPYPDGAKAINGDIVATSVYLSGKYKLSNGEIIKVNLIQDKSFENGNFIYANVNENVNSYIYKYRKVYIIYEISAETFSQEKLSDYFEFFREFYEVVKLYYREK